MENSAVEWFNKEINKLNVGNDARVFIAKLFEQAKEMEKEQIMNAMDWIMNKYFEFHEQPTTSAREQYYNETFKSE